MFIYKRASQQSPRSLLVAGGLLALAVGLAGVDPAARAEDKKPAQAPKTALLPDVDKLFEQLGGGLNEEQQKLLREQLKQMREMVERMEREAPRPGGFGGLFGRRSARQAPESVQETRLGAKLAEPSAALIDQLDLPRNQGLVLEQVGPNSPAAKAGLKANDILLEFDGKAVSTRRGEFDVVLAGVAADKAVDVVVMRKGRKETVKGLTLPEAKAPLPPAPRRNLFGNLPRLPLAPELGGSTSVSRSNDDFTTSHSADGVKFTIKGTVKQGKAEPSDITIVADGKSTNYAAVDKVPAEHREKVKKLLEMSAK